MRTDSTLPPAGRWRAGAAAAATIITLAAADARAQPAALAAAPAPSIWERQTLIVDPTGLRDKLSASGVDLTVLEQSEVLGNVTGGVRRGAAYDGLTTVSLGLDTGKASLWPGGTFNVSALQIHGRNLSTDNLATLQTASGIEAERTFRLWELWYQQDFPKLGLDVKVGQQSLDQEFITSDGSSNFVNTAAGWPLLPSIGLYAGGPAYPLSSLGVRLRLKPSPNWAILAGVFDDNPPGGPFYDDDQRRGAARTGTAFNLRTGALFIAEAQFEYDPPPGGVSESGAAAPALPAAEPKTPNWHGKYKLGVYYDTGTFYGQHYGSDGLSLADPASNGVLRARRHNAGVYGVVDQVVVPSAFTGGAEVGVFLRLMGGPNDRSLIDFSANGGVTVTGLLPKRGSDVAALGFGVGRVSPSASALDRDAVRYSGAGFVRSTETFAELTYVAKIAPWLNVQPDLQYVWNPGGGISNPLNPSRKIRNELVLGVRSALKF